MSEWFGTFIVLPLRSAVEGVQQLGLKILMKNRLILIFIMLLVFSCNKTKPSLRYEEILDEIALRQIGYLKDILNREYVEEAVVIQLLDSLELTNDDIEAETPDSIIQVLTLLYQTNTDVFATIPNSLEITKYSDLKDGHLIGTYSIPNKFKLKKAQKTFHLSDSTAAYLISIPYLKRSGSVLRKYIPCVNYEGYESAFTPPIITSISFNNAADSIKVSYYDNYSGFTMTIIKDESVYKIANLVSEGDF